MKTQALYHLLAAAGRAAGRLLDPSDRARLEAAAASMSIEKAGRGQMRVRWREDGATLERIIDGSRFDFYRRGDVAALVAKRSDDLDLRQANWTEAHRLWGELLDLAILADIAEPPSRAVLDVSHARHREVDALIGPALVLVGIVVALALESAAPAAAGLGLQIVAVGRRRPLSSAGVGVALAVALGIGLDVSAADLSLSAAGIGLVAVSTLVVPDLDSRWETSLVVAALVATAIALAGPGASTGFRAGAAALVAADFLALSLRGERKRPLLAFGVLFAGVLGWVVFESTVSWPSAGTAESELSAAAAIGLAVFLISMVMRGFVVGVRDRLSGWLAPLALAVIALTDLSGPAVIVWLSAIAGALVVDLIASRFHIRPGALPGAGMPQPVAVSIGRQSARVWPRQTRSNSPTNS